MAFNSSGKYAMIRLSSAVFYEAITQRLVFGGETQPVCWSNISKKCGLCHLSVHL